MNFTMDAATASVVKDAMTWIGVIAIVWISAKYWK